MKNNYKGFSELLIVVLVLVLLAIAGIVYWYYSGNLTPDFMMKKQEVQTEEISTSTEPEVIEQELEETDEGDVDKDLMEIDAEVSTL